MTARNRNGGSSSLTRGTLIVFIGSAVGYGVTYLLTPVISRLVDPQVFGQYAVVLAVASSLTGFSTLRLEIFALAQRSEHHKLNALKLGLWLCIGVGLATFMTAAIGLALGSIGAHWLLAGPMVTIGSLQLLSTAKLSSNYAYSRMAAGNLIQGGGTGIAQAGLAAVSPSIIALAAGFILARAHWIVSLIPAPRTRVPVLATWRRARSYVVPAGGSALLNSVGGQLPLLLITYIYGPLAGGVYAMATRLLIGPLSIVAQAVGSTSMGRLGSYIANKDPRALAITNSIYRQLALLGILPCLLACFVTPEIASAILGPEWSSIGSTLRAIALGAYFQFVGAPLMRVLNMTGHSQLSLGWDATRIILFTISIVAPGLTGWRLSTMLLLYAASMVFLYVVGILLVRRSINRVIQ